MDHIRFGYLPGQTIIHDLTLRAPGGTTVAIVGHTGAGKTTLINLLMRFYDPQGGVISVDGKNIQSLTRKKMCIRDSFSGGYRYGYEKTP